MKRKAAKVRAARGGNQPTGPLIDLTGERFGRLEVVRYVGQNEHRVSTWECKCDCGNTIEATQQNLIGGRTKSCGCLKTDVLIGRAENLEGQRFGRLVAKEYVRVKGSRGASWLCQCDCGNEKVVKAASLKSGLTKSCGCLARKIRLPEK